MEENRAGTKKTVIRFLAGAAIGIAAFMIPFIYKGSVNTCVGVLTDFVRSLLDGIILEMILVLLTISASGAVIEYGLEKTGNKAQGSIHDFFKTTPVYLITKVFAAMIAWCYYFSIGPQIMISPLTGGTMIDLGKTLIAIAVALSYFLPFLTDSGLMEFVGVLARPFVRPLFKVPSDASLDLIASWLGASSAAVILSAEKYKKGYYTKRETACVMCNFSLVSIPFCMVIAGTAGVEKYFPAMYGILCILGVMLAVILPRIYPLNRLENSYFSRKKEERKEKQTKQGMLQEALEASCSVAEKFTLKHILKSGTAVLCSICFNLLPIVIAWGTLGLILVEYTPVFQWISLPFGWLLEIMGVAEAYAVAPATLAGFVDMFIPSLLVANIASIETRFIIATLSLIQIIYITEVGAVVIQTGLGIDVKKLFLIFLERTLISLPVIVLLSKLLF